MAELKNNKIVFNGETLIDLTGDTVTESDVLSGKTFHKPDGEVETGTCDFDSDTSDATATASEILSGKTAYARGSEVEGSMPNREGISLEIGVVDEELPIPDGYHDGSGKAKLDAIEKSKIIPNNIKDGVDILGVTGTYTGEGVTAQAKVATPSSVAQTILPDTGYDYLSQVTVEAIPYTVTPNAAGGNTITIG